MICIKFTLEDINTGNISPDAIAIISDIDVGDSIKIKFNVFWNATFATQNMPFAKDNTPNHGVYVGDAGHPGVDYIVDNVVNGLAVTQHNSMKNRAYQFLITTGILDSAVLYEI